MPKLKEYYDSGKLLISPDGKILEAAPEDETNTSTDTDTPPAAGCQCCTCQFCGAVHVPFYSPVLSDWDTCYNECFGAPGTGNKITGGTINGTYCVAYAGQSLGFYCKWEQTIRPSPIHWKFYAPADVGEGIDECEVEIAEVVGLHAVLLKFPATGTFLIYLIIRPTGGGADDEYEALVYSRAFVWFRCNEGPQDIGAEGLEPILSINIPPGDGTCDGFTEGATVAADCEGTDTDTDTNTDTNTDTDSPPPPQPCPEDCSGCAHVAGLYLSGTEGGTLDGFLPDLLRIGDTCEWVGTDATYDVDLVCVQDGADYFWQVTIEADGETFIFRAPVTSGCPRCNLTWTMFSTTQTGTQALTCGPGGGIVTCCQAGDCCFSSSSFVVMTVTKTTSGATSCFGPACCRPDVTHSAVVLNFLSCDGGVAYFQNDDDARYFAQFDGTTWGYGGFGEPLYGYPPREDCSDPGDEALCADYAEPLPSVNVDKDDCAGYVATATGTINFGVCGTVTQVESVSLLVSSNECCRNTDGDCVAGNGGSDGACP